MSAGSLSHLHYGDTVPMPVSGGWATFEAMTGAAFAPIAVAGGVSILACRYRVRKTASI